MAAYKPWLQEGQDYGYKFGNSGIIVSGLSGNLSVSITLAEDFPTLPNSYHFLFDGRRNTAADGSSDNSATYINYSNGWSTDPNPSGITNMRKNGAGFSKSNIGNLLSGDILSFDVTGAGTTVVVAGGVDGSSGVDNLFLSALEITDSNGLHVIDLNKYEGSPEDITGSLLCSLSSPITQSNYVIEDGQIIGYAPAFTYGSQATLPQEVQPFGVTIRAKGFKGKIFGSRGVDTDWSYLSVDVSASNEVLIETKFKNDNNNDSSSYFTATGVLLPDDDLFHTISVFFKPDSSAAVVYRVVLDGVETSGTLSQKLWYGTWGGWTGFLLFAYERADTPSPLSSSHISGIVSHFDFGVLETDFTGNLLPYAQFDLTTGDSNQFIDTLGGLDLSITNNSTTGWQPVIKRQVFNFRDYFEISSLLASENSAPYGVVYYAPTDQKFGFVEGEGWYPAEEDYLTMYSKFIPYAQFTIVAKVYWSGVGNVLLLGSYSTRVTQVVTLEIDGNGFLKVTVKDGNQFQYARSDSPVLPRVMSEVSINFSPFSGYSAFRINGSWRGSQSFSDNINSNDWTSNITRWQYGVTWRDNGAHRISRNTTKGSMIESIKITRDSDASVLIHSDFTSATPLTAVEGPTAFLTGGYDYSPVTATGFLNGLTIRDGGVLNNNLVLATTGRTELTNMKLLDVDATGATDVVIEDCEVNNVTG